jgi:hypothetical protein
MLPANVASCRGMAPWPPALCGLILDLDSMNLDYGLICWSWTWIAASFVGAVTCHASMLQPLRSLLHPSLLLLGISVLSLSLYALCVHLFFY